MTHGTGIRNSAYLLLGILVCTTMMVACLPRMLLYSYQPVQDGWRNTDTIRFQLTDVPSNDIYSFAIGLRYTNSYPYDDIWIAVEQRMPKISRIDTLHLNLAAQQSEEQGVVMHEHESVIRAYRLAKGQNVDVLVYSLMQDSVLEGITDIGLRVE